MVCLNTKDFEYLNRSIWPIDQTLTGTISLEQSELRINANEKVLHIS